MIGHTWTVPESVRPAVMSTAYGVYSVRRKSGKITHPAWALDYTFEPAGRVRVAGGSWFERGAAVGHLYPPLTPYWEDTRPIQGNLTSTYIMFLCEATTPLSSIIHSAGGFSRFEDPDGLLAAHLKNVATLGQDLGDRGFFQAQSIFYQILHLMVHAQPVGRNRFRVREDLPRMGSPFSRAVRAFMKEHLSEPLTLQRLAKETHVSISTLSHSYKSETGESPMTTLMRYRIRAAKSLLLRGYRLQAIADQTAFSDTFHLSKAFKKVEGCSPREYLKRLRS